MPEYLAPGVYVEEVSFRSKSIEGVPTSTTGFAGMTRFGPVRYPGGPKTNHPRLTTSFTEFEQVFGGLEDLKHRGDPGPDTGAVRRLSYVAHGGRAFFMNGGQRLYVARVFLPRQPVGASTVPDATWDWGVASIPIVTGANWRARWPGAYGNCRVITRIQRKAVTPFAVGGVVTVPGVRDGAVLEVQPATPLPEVPTTGSLRVVRFNAAGQQEFYNDQNAPAAPALGDTVNLVEMTVQVLAEGGRSDFYDELAADPEQIRFIGKILQKDYPQDENAIVWLDWAPPGNEFDPGTLTLGLLAGGTDGLLLTGGHDGGEAQPDDLLGKEADPDNPDLAATGLEALQEIEDIAIVAVPGGAGYQNQILVEQAADRLLQIAGRQGAYRVAVVDGPVNASLNTVRGFRGRFDSKYAAMYHPWVEILDPLKRAAQGAPPPRLLLPPSGFVCGVYANTDITRGVHKAPANEIVRGLTQFEVNINKRRQDVLNPEGINALRFFPGRGNRVWGARTMSSDPEWKYVNVRRLFTFIEHSIDLGTQWAVFEPNGPRLWRNVRSTIEDFLLVLWLQGALLGDKPEQAYFVRCDRTTMTQNDLDNGRMICLIGIAPVKPAEFVIFRIGQWTGDANV